MKTLNLILFVLLSNLAFGQWYPKIEEYKHFTILKNNDTIRYHVYSKKEIKHAEGIILFIQGSGSEPLFKIITKENSESIKSQVPFNLDKIPENYAFVVVSKKCLPFATKNANFKAPECFYTNEGLDYRVWQYHEVINHLLKNQIRKPKKVMVIGHSEGSDVVAKLGTINKKITHIGFWSGSGNTQFYDFALLIRKQVSEGKINEIVAVAKMDSLFAEIKAIQKEPNAVNKFWLDNTYRRWHQFSEPAVNNLLKIDVPIFVALGAKDTSVPVESGLLIPVEFLRHKKQNLTFKLYPNYDHSFNKVPTNESEEWEPHWMDVFEEFLQWSNRNSND